MGKAKHTVVGISGGEPAFPNDVDCGMSLRQWFAGHICVAMAGKSGYISPPSEAASRRMAEHRAMIADAAVRQADSLIAALAERGPDDGTA